MFIYLAHNYETNKTMELTEEELEMYKTELETGIIEIFETDIIED